MLLNWFVRWVSCATRATCSGPGAKNSTSRASPAMKSPKRDELRRRVSRSIVLPVELRALCVFLGPRRPVEGPDVIEKRGDASRVLREASGSGLPARAP